MVNGKRRESKESKRPAKECNLSPMVPAGVIRVECWVPACRPCSALTMPPAQEAQLRGRHDWNGRSLKKGEASQQTI